VTHFSHIRKLTRASAPGMTLIEIMVVITILGLIAAAVGVAVVPQLAKAKSDRAKLDIQNIDQGLKLYYTQKGKYPDTGEGIGALVTGKQLESTPKDPWGHDYVYKYPGEHGDEPDIISYGADGQPGGDGLNADIVSWKNQ